MHVADSPFLLCLFCGPEAARQSTIRVQINLSFGFSMGVGNEEFGCDVRVAVWRVRVWMWMCVCVCVCLCVRARCMYRRVCIWFLVASTELGVPLQHHTRISSYFDSRVSTESVRRRVID